MTANQGDPAGAELHQAFNELLASETDNLNPIAVVEACRNPVLLSLAL